MKKLSLLIPAAVLAACLAFGAACGGTTEFVANDATDVMPDDFGIAVKKDDAEMKAAVDAVINAWKADGTLDKYFDYYTALADDSFTPEVPQGLKLSWDLSANTETLDMYTESGFAPYEYIHSSGYSVSDGSAQDSAYSVAGVDVAIACQVAENLKCKLVIHDVAFDSIISHLDNTEGKAIAAAGYSITEERLAQVDFSVPYAQSIISIVGDKEKNYTKLADLDGLKIGVQEGTSGDEIASNAKSSKGYSYTDKNGQDVTVKLTSSKTDVVTYKTYAAALAALQAGKIDVIFMDKVPAQLLIKNI